MEELAQLLRKRLHVIADHEFRDRDEEGHLEALKDVSEKIGALHIKMRDNGELYPRLEHFLANFSFEKALAWIEENAN